MHPVLPPCELYYPAGADGPAFLSVWLASGEKVTVELELRLARLLETLHEA